MAKMSMGNGGLPTSVNFDGVVTHHNNSQADDSRLDRQNAGIYVAPEHVKSNYFTEAETADLLKIWSSLKLKQNSGNCKKWDYVAYTMHKLGYKRTAMQCRNRIQNLITIYHKIKRSSLDYSNFNFPYYKPIGEVFDRKKKRKMATTPGATELRHSGGNSNGIMNNTHNNRSTPQGRMAADMSLVEYNLISGTDETNIIISFSERNSSSNGSSNMNVLSPATAATGSRSSATKTKPSQNSSPSSKADGVTNTSMSLSTHTGGNRTSAGRSMKFVAEPGVTITVEEGSLPSEHSDENTEASDYDDSYMSAGDESPSGRNTGLPRAVKRSFSSSFEPYEPAQSDNGRGIIVGDAAKRTRRASTATIASSTMDDPIGRYLGEMVDIERQWLEMERERAENDRGMMMNMMYVLQLFFVPTPLTRGRNRK